MYERGKALFKEVSSKRDSLDKMRVILTCKSRYFLTDYFMVLDGIFIDKLPKLINPKYISFQISAH